MALAQQQRYAFGLLILLSVVFIWVGSSFLMNHMFSNQDYNKPFAITYLNQASFSLYLFKVLFGKKGPADKERINLSHALYDTAPRTSSEAISINSTKSDTEYDNQHTHKVPQSSATALTLEDNETTFFIRPSSGASHNTLDTCDYLDSHDVLSSVNNGDKLTKKAVAKLGVIFCVLWLAANWSNNASLAYTNVASSTILASMSGFFTLGIGALVGTEKFSSSKLVSVVLSVSGVILISFADKSDMPIDNPHTPSAPLFGNFLALIGAFFYGCSIVLLKFNIQDESRIDMSLFFGFVGVFNVVLLWPIFFFLDLTGVEKFQFPPNTAMWIMVTINALVGTFLSDYLWLLATFMTSPLVVTLGLSLTIPMALAGDVIYKGILLGTQYWLGAFLVVFGFLMVNIAAIGENSVKKTSNFTNEDDCCMLPSNARTTASEVIPPIVSASDTRMRRSTPLPEITTQQIKK